MSNATAAALTPALSQREREFDSLWRALDQLTDPEIPVITLREMGILRDVRRGADGRIEVVITPTYSGCPAMEQIADDVATTLKSEGIDGRVVTQLAPAWTTDWMSQAGRERLREFGISPPGPAAHGSDGSRGSHGSAGPIGVSLGRRVVTCPLCGSTDSEVVSEFGATACKALRRCLNCKEPYEEFKPL